MTASRRAYSGSVQPFQTYLTILALVFACEFLVMLVLPLALPWIRSRWVEAALDAGLLTLMLVPMLWWIVIRPLRAVATTRARLLEQFVTLQEEERRRIAYDLHDEVGQSLTSVLMGLRSLDHLAEAGELHDRLADLRGIVNQAVQEVRRIANGLRSAALDHLGLAAALQRLAEGISETHGLEVVVDADVPSEQRLPAAMETAVYRIVQEALTNAVRHAGAQRVAIVLRSDTRGLSLEIQDDGRGFSESGRRRSTAGRPRLGLAGMAERTALLDGEFSVSSQPGQGTRIRARFPRRAKAPA